MNFQSSSISNISKSHKSPIINFLKLEFRMKGVQVLILLAVFGSTFAAYKKEPGDPIYDFIEAIIKAILERLQLTDPMEKNDTSVELILKGLLLTSDSTDVVITGTNGINLTEAFILDPAVPEANFVAKFEIPILAATGSILHHIQSHFVWPTPIYGDGPFEGHILDIKLEITGELIYPPGVRYIDYKISLGGVFLKQDGLMGGPQEPLHDEIEAHLNAEGHNALMGIEYLNHEYFRKHFDEAINGRLKNINLFSYNSLKGF